VIRGGNWDNGANAGVFAFNANNGPSNVNDNIGFRCGRGVYGQMARLHGGAPRATLPTAGLLLSSGAEPGEKNEVPRGGLVVRPMRTNGRTGQFYVMNTCKQLYERVCSFENMYEAFRKAAKGKSLRLDCAGFAYNREQEIFKLQSELLDGTYRHGPYREFEVNDPKRRQVKAARFRDRVVHHALCNVIEPIFEARFISDSFACRKGKGTFAALARCGALARRFCGGYVLKADISKFFYSVDHGIMLNTLSRRIADKRALALIAEILASSEDARFRAYFPGDGLFALQRPAGIPIGNLTSQLFSNIYLTELDYFVKQELRWKPYLRYMDDFLLFGPDKKELWIILSRIEAFLAEKLRLRVHPKKRTVSPVSRGIDWVGYLVFPERIKVRRRNIFRFRIRNRRLRALFKRGRIRPPDIRQSIMSFCAYTAHASAARLVSGLLWLEKF